MPIIAKTYNPILTKGTKAALLQTAIENNKLRFTTDTGELFLDMDGVRIPIAVGVVRDLVQSQIEALESPTTEKFYFSSDTHLLMYYDGTNWNYIGKHAETADSAAGLSVVNGKLCVTYETE